MTKPDKGHDDQPSQEALPERDPVVRLLKAAKQSPGSAAGLLCLAVICLWVAWSVGAAICGPMEPERNCGCAPACSRCWRHRADGSREPWANACGCPEGRSARRARAAKERKSQAARRAAHLTTRRE